MTGCQTARLPATIFHRGNDDWKKAIEKDGLTWKQVVDNKGWNAKSTDDYIIDAIPASFLIDQDGVIRGVNLEGRELEGTIKKLLNAGI